MKDNISIQAKRDVGDKHLSIIERVRHRVAELDKAEVHRSKWIVTISVSEAKELIRNYAAANLTGTDYDLAMIAAESSDPAYWFRDKPFYGAHIEVSPAIALAH